MKTNLKRISRRSISMLLCVLMLFSTLMVGTISTANAAISGNIYFDNSKTNWSSVYLFIGHAGYLKSYKMSLDSEDIWKTDTTFNNEWNDATKVYFASADGGVSGGNSSYNVENTSRSDLGLTNYTNKSSTIGTGPDICYVPASGDTNANLNIMTVDEAKASHSTVSVSDDIISVLNGTKIMFYAGVIKDWNSSTIYVRTGSDTSTTSLTLSGINSNIVKINNVDCYYGIACLSSATYYISNSSTWSGVKMGESAVAGKYYILNNSSTLSGSTSNNVYANASSGSASTTIGTGNVVSTSFTSGKSGISQDYSLVYYIKDSSNNYSKVGTSTSEVNTYISTLEDGTYKLYTCLTDKKITVLKDTDEFTKSSKRSVSTSGSNFTSSGTGEYEPGENVTVTLTPETKYMITDVSVTPSTLVYNYDENTKTVTFTMPNEDVTIAVTTEKDYSQSTLALVGRFKVRTAEGADTFKYLGGSEGAWLNEPTYNNNDITFTYDSTEKVFKLNTYMTVKELSDTTKGTQYFRFYLDEVGYGRTKDDGDFAFTDTVKSGSFTKATDRSFYFEGINDTGLVVLIFDPYKNTLSYEFGQSTLIKHKITDGTAANANGSIGFYSDSDYNTAIEEACKGDTVYVKVTPDSGYMLDTLTYNDGTNDVTINATDDIYSFTMPDSAVTVTATFKEKEYNLTSTPTNCTVKFYSDAELKNEITKSTANQTVYVQVTPNTNYEVSSVTANDGTVTLTDVSVSDKENVYSFTMPSNDVIVTAKAQTIKKKVTFTFYNSSLTVKRTYSGLTATNNNITSGTELSVDIGTTIYITATPNTGYEAAEVNPWQIEPTPNSAAKTENTTCSFTVSEDTSVIYNTQKIKYNISYVYNPEQGGTTKVIKDSTETEYLSIDDTFTVETTANERYAVDRVEVKVGEVVISPNENGIYTMTVDNLDDVTVTTTFKAAKPTITLDPASTEMFAGATYSEVYATTDFGTLSYSTDSTELTVDSKTGVITAPNKEGNYTITVTATNEPAGITTAETATKSFTVTVVFTETQQAYKDLEEKFAEIGHEESDDYENNAAWKAYEAAVSAANTLLATFPPPDANNTDDYVYAKTTLQNAYNKIQQYRRVNTIYVLSKYSDYVNIYMFNNDTSEYYEPVGNVTPIQSDSDKHVNAYPMTKVGKVTVGSENKYLYKFEYYGKGDFIIYVGGSENNTFAYNKKLTGDVKFCKEFTSYYLDLQNETAGERGTDYSKNDAVSPYAKLSVKLNETSGSCVEDAVYDLTTKIPKTESGTLKETSGVTVTHTYTYTFNGETFEINDPATWVPTVPGVYTITVHSSNGIEAENAENTFTLYVQDKLDTPNVLINDLSTDTVTVNNKKDVVITVAPSGADYPEGVEYVFTVDEETENEKVYTSNVPTYTFKAGSLALGDHTVTVKVVAPDTTFEGMNTVKMYADSDSSTQKTVTIETVKCTYYFDFTKCHVNNSVTYMFDGVEKTYNQSTGPIRVDRESEVTFTVAMIGNYVPIPKDDCWSGVDDATIGGNKLSYTFTANESNDGKTVVFKSYLPVAITPGTQDIEIGTSAEINITELDDNATYQLQYKKDGETEYQAVNNVQLVDGKFTTQNLPYGKYQFIVRQIVHGYDFTSNEVDVNAVIGNVVLKYLYHEYDTNNGVAYDPYIGKENNIKKIPTEYSVTLNQDISTFDSESTDSLVTIYNQYAPTINSNYFNYNVNTQGIKRSFSADNKVCTIESNVMTPTERTYKVSINGVQKFTSYYQQKTFLLNADDYCDTKGTYGYVWYNVVGDKEVVVSTDQYYKLRVARDTNLKVKPLNEKIATPTTFINEPVYNEYPVETADGYAVKVQMHMLVENYLPEDAVRTRTGVVYYSYENGETPPTVDSSELPGLITNSDGLKNVLPGKTCKVGDTTKGVEIKGYYTDSDNVNGKFIFAPIASIDSTKVYVVYSYLTYTTDSGTTTTVISANPVTASATLRNNSTQTS